MAWYQTHNFKGKIPVLEARMQITRAIRHFFDSNGFWAVETPVLQTMPGADTHIHAYRVENGQYLQNSPEFAMKKLLVAGCPKIYQICPVFRKEERTKLHNPEFTMLEWYRAGADYTQIMQDCQDLLAALPIKTLSYQGITCDLAAQWQIISVNEAFDKYAGIDLEPSLHGSSVQSADHMDKPCDDAVKNFKAQAQNVGIRVTEHDAWDDVFHAVMAAKIEPHLGQGAPTILYDYPANMAALSRKKPGDPRFAERFELYACGVELANAFSELTDATEQRARFMADMAEKQRLYGESYPIDEEFLAALEHSMPESAGIALGVDRLVMLATNAKEIRDVCWTH